MACVHFITFGDGSPQTRGAATRLQREASQSGIFATVDSYHLKRILDQYPEFWKRHGSFLLNAKRGLGYYLWKPFLISTKLGEISEQDFLVYADAGCEIPAGATSELFDLLPTEPAADLSAVPLEPFHTMERWTNKCCLTHLDGAKQYLNRPMIAATFMFFRNTEASRKLAASWLEWSEFNDYCCLVDRPGEPESAAFAEHRHDQSIFSLLLYDFEQKGAIGLKRIDVERTKSAKSAILGVRNRTPFRAVGTNKYKRKLLSKCYSAAVKLFWNEEKYRAELYDSLRS
jgi:hypothetical protein